MQMHMEWKAVHCVEAAVAHWFDLIVTHVPIQGQCRALMNGNDVYVIAVYSYLLCSVAASSITPTVTDAAR